jgi:PTS system nitrogen regulatory IIA component
MNLRRVLSKSDITVSLQGRNKEEVLSSLMDILMAGGKVHNREVAMNAILEREKKMSTGIQNGVAIPHGKTDAVEELVACLGIKKEGVDFDALDGEKSRIFIMTLSPVNKAGPHVQFLAEISQLLTDSAKREKLLAARSSEEVLDILTS